MGISKYLENELAKSKELKEAQAKKILLYCVILAIVAVVAYIGISSSDPRAASTATFFSGVLGIICIIFLIKFLRLRTPISDKVIHSCEQEIKNNLKSGETFETFDGDMMNPAFGVHTYIGGEVIVGKEFILFKRINPSGPKFQIFRGDILGEFKVYYSANAGTTQDIGMDLKDKRGKFIRSIMCQDKESFYKLLDAFEKVKSYANGDTAAEIKAEEGNEDDFVKEAKSNIQRIDRKSQNKLAITGLVFGAFLTIAGSSSGVAFIYAGIALFIVSLAGLIFINLRAKLK